MRIFLSEIGKHFAATIIYFAGLTLVYVFQGGPPGWPLVSIWLGALIGAELLDIDHVFYAYITHRDAPTSLEIRKLIRKKRYAEALSYIAQHHKDFKPAHLIIHKKNGGRP